MSHPIHRVTHFSIVGPYTLAVAFADGTEQRIDFEPGAARRAVWSTGDLATFNGTKLDSEVGTLVWPNDADFDPAHDWPELIEELGKRAQAWTPAASEPRANKRMEPTRPGSLEALGYLARSNVPDEGRARIVRLTKRGRAAYKTIHDILRNIEREWIAELGPRPFADLKALLTRVWESPLAR